MADLICDTSPIQYLHQLGQLDLLRTLVLQLALEMPGTFVLLDDRVARRIASRLNIPLKGTVGFLIDAKRAGLLPEIRPLLDQLDAFGFRLAAATRATALRLAGESVP